MTLLIFQYGVNVLFRPNDVNFNWYNHIFLPVVQKLKRSFANSDIILVSTADRAFCTMVNTNQQKELIH